MNIKEVKTAFKIADVVLDIKHPKNHIKFIYLSEIKDDKGILLKNDVLTDEAGRVYLIVVNNIIKKIGGSQGKGGMKSTLNFYQASMQGRPSISRYGTHLLIEEELNKGSKVEIYMISSKELDGPIKGLFSEDNMGKIAPFKEMEDKCKEDYKSKEKDYPEWNFQERHSPWPSSIQEKHANYMKTRVGKKESES